MKDFNPTPGPYHVRGNYTPHIGGFFIADETGDDLAIVSCGDIHGRANAILFAASKELLEAMEAQNAFIAHLAGRVPEQGMGCQNLFCPDGCEEGKNLLDAARDAYQCALAKLNDTPKEAT